MNLFRLIVSDIIRNRIVLIYTLILSAFTWSTFLLEDNTTKGILTILNIVLLIIPLFSLLFTTIYLYNSAEFIELLVSQPLSRKKVWSNLFTGMSFNLILSVLLSIGIPVFIFVETSLAITILLMSVLISMVFLSIAFLTAVSSRDKSRGMGISILVWLFLALLFDILVLFILFQFSDYPIEQPAVFLTALNPVDLARIMILIRLDVSALMGYTGVIFKNYFGSGPGLLITIGLLVMWIVTPFLFSLRKFKRRDL